MTHVSMAFDCDHRISSGSGSGRSANEHPMHHIVPMIVRVYSDGVTTDVPVTPSTTCQDLIECCRDPGDEDCQLVGITTGRKEWPLKSSDKPLEILQHWNSSGRDSLRLVLRYTVLQRPPPPSPATVNGDILELSDVMKEPGHVDEFVTLPDGVQLTLQELRDMACRQKHQIESQHQLLAAREQRLRFLKEQEATHQLITAENERLRRLLVRVDTQELKLRKLRALRGQVDQNKQTNVSLTSDLDAIRALFNEKEKELSLAVAKVDELTRQLEETRRGIPSQAPSAATLELDKLRKELMYRNKLNEQQKVRLCQQREALSAKQEEMTSVDKRIGELQDRLHRKRISNQQLVSQISSSNHKPPQLQQQVNRCTVVGVLHHQNTGPKKPPRLNALPGETLTYIPNSINHSNDHSHKPEPPVSQKPHYAAHSAPSLQPPLDSDSSKSSSAPAAPEFGPSKADPKYQTLPYNTKFTINVLGVTGKHAKSDHAETVNDEPSNNLKSMTVHSTPLSIINKSLATPLNQNLPGKVNGDVRRPPFTRGQPVGAPVSTAVTQQSQQLQQQKPVNSAIPSNNNNNNNNKPSTIYQTSSTKIPPVQPQTIQSSPQFVLSPPQSQSTPLGTPETESNKNSSKPALPPKPINKPPPTQTQSTGSEESKETTNEEQQHAPPPPPPPSQQSLQLDGLTIIRPKPLTIKKQPLGEQPRLRSSLTSKINGYNVSINRRIEMPPAFLFPEMNAPPADLLGSGDRSSPNGATQNGKVPASPPQEEKSKEDQNDAIISTNTNSDETKEEKTTNSTATILESTDKVDNVVKRIKKGNLKRSGKSNLNRRVSFDPLALLLDASLEGELELVKKTVTQVPDPSAANDEGITALHNAICAGHLDIVKFLVEFGCDVNAPDTDGWTPLHCAGSCNNVPMVRFLVEHGACLFATTLSDHETPAEKCEEDDEGYDGCCEYLYSLQEKLGILSGGAVYAVFDYIAQQSDELSFKEGQKLTVLRKGDENEREWWWARLEEDEGYIPRNLLGLYPRVTSKTERPG